MATRLQLRKGTTTEHSTFVGANGEVTVDTTNKTLKVHDGTTVGGTALAKVSQLPASASATTQGLIEIATQTEVNAGTDSTRAIVPNTLLGGMRTHLNASGTAPIYACRAWVNFDGTGTVAIRASGNVSSITDNGVGDYTINFTTGMPDANYSFSGFCTLQASISAAGIVTFGNDFTMSSSSLRIKSANATTGGAQDSAYITVGVFR